MKALKLKLHMSSGMPSIKVRCTYVYTVHMSVLAYYKVYACA